MHNLNEIQNDDNQIELREAIFQIYKEATHLKIVQLCIVVLIPIAIAAFGLSSPSFLPYLVIYTLLLTIVDPLVIEAFQKKKLMKAAKISEQFDVLVFGLKWNNYLSGDRISPELIFRASKKMKQKNLNQNLSSWYPDVSAIPVEFGRIISQRTNVQYDKELRKLYRAILIIIAIVCVVVFLTICIRINLAARETIIILSLFAPFINWTIRELISHNNAQSMQYKAMKMCDDLWKRALGGENNLTNESRALQDLIFSFRASSPIIMPFIYKFKREKLESEMKVGAEKYIEDYKGKYRRN